MHPKDYLTAENVRNKASAQLYVDIMKQALGEDWDVLIGHHIMYEHNGDVETEGEVPSADTLIFDHDIMITVFGCDAIPLMQELAALRADERDALLAERFEAQRL